MAITHAKVSAIADGADTTLIRPSDWNADHVVGEEEAEARPKYGTTELRTIPNVGFVSLGAYELFGDYLFYFPFAIRTPVTITEMMIEVVTKVTGKAVRLGIYRADKDWQPTSLVSDAGTLSVNDVAEVSLTGLSIALQEGRYLIALHSEDAPTLRVVRAAQPFAAVTEINSGLIIDLLVAKAYGVLADPGIAWNEFEQGLHPFLYPVFLTFTP